MGACAKTQSESQEIQRRECVWVANRTKTLLVRFCVAQRLKNESNLTACAFRAELDEAASMPVHEVNINIDKETFLFVLSDAGTHTLLNDLEIQCERARLFDVLDADDSGSLGIKELIEGLLEVRGEPQRSDVLAGTLGVRALLNMSKKLEELVTVGHHHITDQLKSMEHIQVSL